MGDKYDKTDFIYAPLQWIFADVVLTIIVLLLSNSDFMASSSFARAISNVFFFLVFIPFSLGILFFTLSLFSEDHKYYDKAILKEKIYNHIGMIIWDPNYFYFGAVAPKQDSYLNNLLESRKKNLSIKKDFVVLQPNIVVDILLIDKKNKRAYAIYVKDYTGYIRFDERSKKFYQNGFQIHEDIWGEITNYFNLLSTEVGFGFQVFPVVLFPNALNRVFRSVETPRFTLWIMSKDYYESFIIGKIFF